jgi:glutaminase
VSVAQSTRQLPSILDEQMLTSVRTAGGERNRAIAKELAQFGYLDAEETALDTYNHVCCLSGTVTDLASLGMLLVQCKRAILPEHRRTVNALMTTCGLYEIHASRCRWDSHKVRGKRCLIICNASSERSPVTAS